MRTSFHFPARELVQAHERVRQVLTGHEELIFQAMAEVVKAYHVSFELPAGPGEFDDKHEEIRNLLRHPTLLGGHGIAMDLMEQIGRQIQASGGIAGVAADQVFSQLFLQPSNSDARVQLNPALHWQAEWKVPSPIPGDDEKTEVFLEVYGSEWGEVVPKYVVEYVNAAIDAHRSQMHGPAVALLSIAVEAVVRDVLEPRGYTFRRGAPAVHVYSYRDADVGVDGNSYTVTFREPMPKSPVEFLHSTGGDPTVEIGVRRKISPRSGRVDLAVIAPTCLIDHWSASSIEQPAQRRVNSLGEALEIARDQEGLVAPRDLPTDFDEIVLLLRNNLVHLSEQALDEPLRVFDPSGGFTLGDFLSDPLLLHDFVTSIPRFINAQYVELRKAGHLAV